MIGFANPVLDADWPDPDVVRVGDEYVLVASSFHRVPGLPLLRSRDLVSWEHVGHALPRLVPEEHFSLPRHGAGVWAPSIRHHDGMFHVVYPDPDHGIFVTSAVDPAGEWSAPRLLLGGVGLIDPCPFWDDGRAYLAHGWARSRAGVGNRIDLVEVTPDLTAPLGPGRTIIDGEQLTSPLGQFRTLEGPKIYHLRGEYWVFAPAGGVTDGWQSVFRSASITGPYEHRVVLAQGDTPVNGPHQGALVEAPDGSEWFVHFSDRGPVGRVVHVQPVEWGSDGWPVLGEPAPTLPEGIGQPVLGALGPGQDPGRQALVPGETGFAGADGALSPAWHWQANPREGMARVLPGGALELAVAPDDDGCLRRLPHVLSRLLPGRAATVEARFAPRDLPAGARVGLALLGRSTAWAGLAVGADGGAQIVLRSGDRTPEEVQLGGGMVAPPHAAFSVRAEVSDAAEVTFAVVVSGEAHALGTVPAVAGDWVGAELGVFAAAPRGTRVGDDAAVRVAVDWRVG